jgi:hypothetical protein
MFDFGTNDLEVGKRRLISNPAVELYPHATTEQEATMAMKPGTGSGKRGGIFQEVGPRGGPRNNFATVAENTRLPPTTESGNHWQLVDETPHGTRPNSRGKGR